MMDYNCSFCGATPEGLNISDNFRITHCPNCGKWVMHCNQHAKLTQEQKNRIKEYLFYHKKDDGYCFIGTPIEFEDYKGCAFPPSANKTEYVSLSTIDLWHPKTISEKIDYILLKLAELSVFTGDYVNINKISDSLFFLSDKISKNIVQGYQKKVQVDFMLDFLKNESLIKTKGNGFIQLSSKAWERVYKLQSTQKTNKNVFVSMAFNDGTKETREAIRKGIENAGFSADLIDEIIHNKQIVPEMLRLIKECRFLIMDITEPNFGAYYEAGYAAGLGKEVIITCKEDVFNQKDFQCPVNSDEKDCSYYRKALKPHFDIAQKQNLQWKNADDLTKKLTEWIKYLFPLN